MYCKHELNVLIEIIFDQDVNQDGQTGTSSSELLISNTQLRHAGRYSCTAQTPVDNVTASAELVVRGQTEIHGIILHFIFN